MAVKKLNGLSLIALFTVLAMLSWPASAQAGLEFKVRLHGGLGYLVGGDLNSGVEGQMEMYKNLFLMGGGTSEGSFKPAHFGAALGGDLILQLSPAFGVGIGTGYIQASRSSEVAMAFLGNNYTLSASPELHSIPVKLNVFVSLPSGPVTFNFHGGLGYYLSKLSYILRFDGPAAFSQYDVRLNTKGGFGFQGGAGLEFPISSALSLFLEAEGRYLVIDGFDGTLTATATGLPASTITGKLYNYEQMTAVGNYRWTIVSDLVLTEIPSAKAREAKIDFSGVALVIGLSLRI